MKINWKDFDLGEALDAFKQHMQDELDTELDNFISEYTDETYTPNENEDENEEDDKSPIDLFLEDSEKAEEFGNALSAALTSALETFFHGRARTELEAFIIQLKKQETEK